MSVIILTVDEVMRTLSSDDRYPFVVNDKEVDIVRFALNTGFTDVVLDEHSALRVMYQRPGETEVRAKTLTYHDTDGLRNYYDWQLLSADLTKKGTLTVALCILRTDGDVEEWHTTPCQVRVLDTIHTDDSDEGDESITPTVAQRVAILESVIHGMAGGAPIVVGSMSDMTDTDQIYVLSTDGNWYYHNGSAWVAGGEYGAVATDTTLTQAGVPADAKATGDAIDAVKADLDDLQTDKVSAELFKKCELVEVPASANLWDASTVSEGLLHTNGQVYIGGSYDLYCYYDIGTVEEGDILCGYSGLQPQSRQFERVVAYDSTGSVMPSAGGVNVTNYTVPAGVSRIAISILKAAPNFMVLINPESTPTAYIPYAEADRYYLATSEFIPNDILSPFVADKVDKDGIGQVTIKNSVYMHYSPNLFDTSKVTDGYFVNQSAGNIQESSIHGVSDWIVVKGDTDYALSCSFTRDFRYCWYDENKTYISGAISASGKSFALIAPSNAAYIRFSTSNIHNVLVQFEEGSEATAYEEYGSGYLLPKYMPVDSDITLNLPTKIYALEGYELNVYFENLTEDWEEYQWDVTCDKGMQLKRGYRINPTNSDVGEHTLTITATNQSGGSVSKTTTLVVTASSAKNGVAKKLIVLGDSTTNNGIAVTKLNQNLVNDVMSITTLGTRGTAPNNHEGRSGWKFSSYFNPPNAGDVASGVENPWYNPSTETFDANYYFANSGIEKPDWLFINLGINDMFGYTNDFSLASAINDAKDLCNEMIASIKSVSADTKIGLCLTIPPNHSQDAFGKAYKCNQTRDRYKRNNVIWVQNLIETYDGKESDGIYLVPIYVNLDTVYNMGMETLPVNARNTDVTYQSPIANGGVHPVESGYWQIADVYTAFLKAQA